MLVTLVGFSLGARVVIKCLQELAHMGNNEGIVERAVLIGELTGRFVNVYSTNDWILGITFRTSLFTQGLAGIQAVDVPGVENVDVTELVFGHSPYLSLVQQVMDHLARDEITAGVDPCSQRAEGCSFAIVD